MKKHVVGALLFATLFTGGLAGFAAERPLIFKHGRKIIRFLETKDFGTNVLSKTVLSEAATREVLNASFQGTIADDALLKVIFVPGRAGTVKGADIVALVKPAGGTNTVAVEKIVAGSATTLLNAATFDPTTISANGTAQALTLTGTTANLSFNAADALLVTLDTGTQSTDAQNVGVGLEVEFNDTP